MQAWVEFGFSSLHRGSEENVGILILEIYPKETIVHNHDLQWQ